MVSSEWFRFLLDHGQAEASKATQPSARILGAVLEKAAEELSTRDRKIEKLEQLLHNAIIKSGETL